MPGIVGVIAKVPSKELASCVSQMVKTMMHEPFYKSTTYTDESLRLAIGWVGHERSFSDCMPVWNPARNICLIFSGEEYSDQREISRLIGSGYAFQPHKADYLVHLYESQGDKVFEMLNGRFSGVLVDFRSKEVILFNDRYGLGRLYFHENEEGFYFASEAKALLEVLPRTRQFDVAGLGEWFSCGCTLNNKTLFSALSLLPGGAVWRFTPEGKCRKESYFSIKTWEDQAPLGETEYYHRLKETFARVLPRYCTPDERIAISLTGGVDSRLVMAWDKHDPGTLPCYTFGGSFRECKDVSIARQVATICRQPHTVIPVADEYLSQFPRLAEQTVFFSDGCMDVSASPDLYANRLVRQIAPIRLTGNYGGEIFRNIVAFKPMPMENTLFQAGFQEAMEVGRKAYFHSLGQMRLSFIVFNQVPWHHYSRLSLESSQLTVRSPYLDNELVALAFRAPKTQAASTAMFLNMIADGNPALGVIGTDRNIVLGTTSIGDRLKHLLQEFTFRAEYAFDYGMPNWLVKADTLLSPLHLERLFLGRHKFYHFRYWYRHALAPYVREILFDSRTRSRAYLDGRRLESIVRGHTEGSGNYTLEIHRVLTAELIHRQLLGG